LGDFLPLKKKKEKGFEEPDNEIPQKNPFVDPVYSDFIHPTSLDYNSID